MADGLDRRTQPPGGLSADRTLDRALASGGYIVAKANKHLAEPVRALR